MTLDEARMILNIKEPTLEHEEEMVKVSQNRGNEKGLQSIGKIQDSKSGLANDINGRRERREFWLSNFCLLF